jgi:hypothetical protein
MALSIPIRVDSESFLTDDHDKVAATLPEALRPLADKIVRSRRILDWPDDFDGEGSPSYDQAVWLRAVVFVVSNALRLWQDRGIAIPAPDIGPGPWGSVDVHWRRPGRELLLNIPVNEHEPIDYYGHDGSFVHDVRGALDPEDDNSWLMQWLATA